LISSVLISKKLFIGVLNGHVGSTRVGFDGVYGGFGYGSKNQEGEGILNFTLAYDLFVMNTLFRKRVSHLVTFSSGQHCSQIDFILTRREDRHACLDCKVVDFRFQVHFQRSKRVQAPRTKWWKLKEDVAKMFKERVLKEDPWHEGGDANSMWMGMTTYIRKVASKEFGVTKGGKREAKETW
jgi:hypothetical protein